MYLTFPHKMLRAEVIKEYVGDKKVVCFSCGNASRALKAVGVNTLCIGGDNGVFEPKHWFTQKEIAEIFSDYFDATPGHLPMELMLLIADKYRKHFARYDIHENGKEYNMLFAKYNLLNNDNCDTIDDSEYNIMCGSGETLVCLKLAFPEKKFNACYNVRDYEKETAYNGNAPLNDLVELLANKISI